MFPKGSPLVQDVSEAILQVRESGKMRELEDGLIASSKCPSSADDDKNNGLSLDSFIGLFLISIGTSTVMLLIHFFTQLRNCWQIYMDNYLGSFIRKLHNLLNSFYWPVATLGMGVSQLHPNGNHGGEIELVKF